jgi:hypothetical protein
MAQICWGFILNGGLAARLATLLHADHASGNGNRGNKELGWGFILNGGLAARLATLLHADHASGNDNRGNKELGWNHIQKCGTCFQAKIHTFHSLPSQHEESS